MCYNDGKGFDLYYYYILIELLVALVETIIYLLLIKKLDNKYTTLRIILYAVCANVLSFIFGLLMITIIPLL